MKAMTIVLDTTLCLFQMENVSWSLQIIYFNDSHPKKSCEDSWFRYFFWRHQFLRSDVFDVLVARTRLAWEQALRGTLAVGPQKEGELATAPLEFEFLLQFPCGSPSTELSDFRQSARSGNKCECKHRLKNTWKHVPRVMTSLLMSSPPISISHRLFRCRYSNSRDVVASSPSFSRPAARAPRRACLQARTSTVGYWAAFSVGGSHKAVESSRKNIAKVQQSCFGLVQLFFNF